jgi:exopolysaccharide biosynthesis polyprenyl glycosylphosphotransferase
MSKNRANSRPHILLTQWFLVITDLVLINAAFATAYYLRYDLQLFRNLDPVYFVPYSDYLGLQLGYTVVLIATLKLDGAWNLHRGTSWLDEVYTIINGTTTGMVIILVVIFGIRPLAFSRLLFLYVSVLTVLFLSLSRLARRTAVDRLRQRGIGVDRTLIVGAGEVGRAVMRTLVARPDLGYQVIGFLESDRAKGGDAIGRFQRLGDLDDLASTLAEHAVSEVIITLPSAHSRRIQQMTRVCRRANVRARIVPDFYHLSLNQVDMDNLAGIPLLGVRETTLERGSRLAKRIMDVIGGVAALLLFSPVIGLVALVIRLDSKGPVLFRQERLGENGTPFEVLKFRSMHVGAEAQQENLAALNEADGPLFKIKDDPRSTRVGRFLRRTSLDELPQLINVLQGHMSLVGPRPPLASEVVNYESWQRKRLKVKPGMTGLWQISGRSDLTFDEMCLLDIYYIENWSLWLDVRVILRTLPLFFFGRGAY